MSGMPTLIGEREVYALDVEDGCKPLRKLLIYGHMSYRITIFILVIGISTSGYQDIDRLRIFCPSGMKKRCLILAILGMHISTCP